MDRDSPVGAVPEEAVSSRTSLQPDGPQSSEPSSQRLGKSAAEMRKGWLL